MNAAKEDGWTIASLNGLVVLRLCNLLKSGANVNAVGEGGRTSLMFASQNGHSDTAGVLLNSGADISAECNKRWTAVMYAW